MVCFTRTSCQGVNGSKNLVLFPVTRTLPGSEPLLPREKGCLFSFLQGYLPLAKACARGAASAQRRYFSFCKITRCPGKCSAAKVKYPCHVSGSFGDLHSFCSHFQWTKAEENSAGGYPRGKLKDILRQTKTEDLLI